MLNFLFNLKLEQVVLINIALIAVNLLFSFFVKKIVERKYNKTQSIEQSLYIQQMLGEYVQFLLMIITSLLSTLTIVPHIKNMGKYTILIILVIVFIFIGLILIGHILILYKINTFLRNTTATRKEQLETMIRIFIFSAIPVTIMFATIPLISDKINASKNPKLYLEMLIPMVIYMIILLILQLFTKYTLKAKPLNDVYIHNSLLSFANDLGLKSVKLFTWPTKNNKQANAFISGLINKDIFISDYFLEKFTLEETKSIIAHEVGHVKKHHSWIRIGSSIVLFILIQFIVWLMEIHENHIYKIPIRLGTLLIISSIILYLAFFMYYLLPIQERQADAFVISIGIEPLVFISALYKLGKLNHVVFKFNKIDEKLQTHPSIAKRIKWIMEQGNVSQEDIDSFTTS